MLSIGARYSLPSDNRIAYTQVPNGNSHPLFLSAWVIYLFVKLCIVILEGKGYVDILPSEVTTFKTLFPSYSTTSTEETPLKFCSIEFIAP